MSHALRRRLLAACLACAALAARADEVVVIVHKDNPNPVSPDLVMRIYTGAIKGWPDGNPVMAFDQAEDAQARELFCSLVLRRSPANIKAIWSQNIFTGKGLPPKIAAPDAAMKRAVATNRNAIGYILSSQLDDSVKAIGR